MRKTNSKEVKKIVRQYIMDGFQPEAFGYDQYLTVNKESEKEVAKAILDCLREEKIVHDRRKLTHFEYFEEWVSGLCNMVNSAYYYNVSAVDLLGTWLDETEAEKAKYTESQAEQLITKLLYRELLAMER